MVGRSAGQAVPTDRIVVIRSELLLARHVLWHCRHTATLLSAPPDRTVTCNIAKQPRWSPRLLAKAADVPPVLTR